MLPKKYKLPSEVISSIFKHKNTIHTKLASIWWVENDCSHPRFLSIVPKKVAKSATARNQTKRRVYNIINTHLPEYDASVDILFRWKTKYSTEIGHQFHKTILEALIKIKHKHEKRIS